MATISQIRPNLFEVGGEFIAAKQIISLSKDDENKNVINIITAARIFSVEFSDSVAADDTLIMLINVIGGL